MGDCDGLIKFAIRPDAPHAHGAALGQLFEPADQGAAVIEQRNIH